MALNLNFNFGRLLQIGEKLTTARINAIVRGINASITGAVGTTDLAAGAVTAAKATPDAYFYTGNCVLIGTTYNVTGLPVTPPALTDGLVLYFKADANNAGPANLTVAGVGGAATISKYGGKALVAGDIKANQIVAVQYNTTLVAQPTWQMISLPATRLFNTEVPVQGSAKNLVVKNNGASPTVAVDIAVDEVLLKDANGLPYLAGSVLVTANIGTAGANGLDTGALTAATWYYVWVIYDAVNNVVAALLSTSATAPTLPGTYTFKALVGTVHAGIVGGSTTDFMTFYQVDREVWLDDTAVFTAKTGVTAWTAVAGADLTVLQALVPPIAKEASGNMGCSANNNGGMAVGADANALGASAMNGTPIAATTLSYTLASGWRCPLKTAQTVYYLMANTTAATYRLSVRGYRI